MPIAATSQPEDAVVANALETAERPLRREALSAPVPRAAETGFGVTVFNTLAAAERDWRLLERTAILTPYQRYDWIKALDESRGHGDADYAIAVIHSDARPVALLPLAVRRHFGVRTAGIIGADIANAGWMVLECDIAAELTPAVMTRLLREIGVAAGGIEILVLTDQPESWNGLANPLLAFDHQPGPNPFYLGPVGDDGSSERLSGKRLRNILRGKRRLEEAMGPVALRQARTAGEIELVHAAFLEQRQARFIEMGVRNVFADPWFVDFFKHAATISLGSERPALRFHALYAGDEIVATSCGTCAGAHYSQYINSTSSGPAARYSLMGILMHELFAELAAAGVTTVDMGLGEFDYKLDWTSQQTVYDGVVPLTNKGRLAAPVLLGLRRLKRAIKHNPVLFGALKRLRGLTLRRHAALPTASDPEESR